MSIIDDLDAVEVESSSPTYQKGWEPRVTEGQYEAEAVSTAFVEGGRPDEDQLIRLWNLDPKWWEIIDGSLLVNRWQGMSGKSQGNKLVWLYQYKARLRRRIDPNNLPLGLHTSPNMNVKVQGRGKSKKRFELPGETWGVGVFYPDPQFGYWWDESGKIHTIHDERCFDIRNQVMMDLRSSYGRIDKIVGAGDTGDFTHFSSFTSTPNYVERTLQPTLDRTSLEWQQLRAICPDRENEIIQVLDGNHDNPRLITSLIKKGLGTLVGVRQGGESYESDPVLSVQHLTQTEKWGIEYVEPFPQASVEFNSSLGCAHGPAYSSKKLGTALAILGKTRRSMLHGHTHREENVAVTLWTEKGPRTYYVGSPGTFCRTDMVVPSAKSNSTSRGTPAVGVGTEDWQAGFNIVLFDKAGEGHFEIESIRIWGGKADEGAVAYWRGRKYSSTCDADGHPLSEDRVR